MSLVAILLHQIAHRRVICATVNKLWAIEDLAVITSFGVGEHGISERGRGGGGQKGVGVLSVH